MEDSLGEIWRHFARVLRLAGAEASPVTELELARESEFFSAALNEYYQWPADFMHGSLALPWCLHFLVINNLAESLRGLPTIFSDCLNRYRRYYYDTPVQFNPADRIWPVGIVSIALWTDEDSVFRYTLEEQIIHRIRDCELILTQEIPGLNNPRQLSAGILHSMLYFLRQCLRRKIFPHKCAELITVISNLDYERGNSFHTDIVILDYMLGYPVMYSDTNLSDLGFFAFVYDEPELFPIEMMYGLSDLTLAGLILGEKCYGKNSY